MVEVNRYFDRGYIGGVIGSYRIVDIIESTYNSKNPIWVMECSCGKRIEVIPSWVINNGIGGCECGSKGIGNEDCDDTFEITKLDRDRLRRLRRLIISKCYNVNDTYYREYGEKGIKIQRSWLKSLDEFVEWSLNNGYRPWLYLRRFNSSKGYTERNCYWGKRNSKIHKEEKDIDIKELDKLNIDRSILLKLIDTNDIREEDLEGIEAFLNKIYQGKSRRPVVKIRKEIDKSVTKVSNDMDSLLTMIQSYNITNGVDRVLKVQQLVEQAIGLLVLANENLGEVK